MFGGIVRREAPPSHKIPLVAQDGFAAAHALPGTTPPGLVRLTVKSADRQSELALAVQD